MSDPFEGLFPLAPRAEVLAVAPTGSGKLEQLRSFRDELLTEHGKILRDVARFRDINPADLTPPVDWILEYGDAEAQKMLRIAQASWMDAKAAPVGLKISTQIVSGILKSMARERLSPNALNIQVVQIIPQDAPEPSFPELEVE